MTSPSVAAVPGEGVPMLRDARSPRIKRIYGGALVAAAAGCGAAIPWIGFWGGMGAFILGVSGLSVLVASFAFAGRAPCPECGREIADLPRESDGRQCAGCGAWAVCRGERVFPTPDRFAAQSATYPIPIEPGAQPSFPAVCAACGAAATRSRPWEMTKTGASIPGVARQVKRWPVEVPVCERCEPAVTGFEGILRVRSHWFWLRATGRR